MKNRANVAIVVLCVLNIAGFIWVVSLPRDDDVDRSLLAEAKKTLATEADASPPSTSPPKASVENTPDAWKMAATEFEKNVAAQKKVVERLSGPKAKQEEAIGMQSWMARSYVQRFDSYRTASYFFGFVFLLNAYFIISVATAKELCLQKGDADKSADCMNVCKETDAK